jgi:phospholipase C
MVHAPNPPTHDPDHRHSAWLTPYAKAGYISLLLHSHVSLVKFCEDTFGLTTLNARDAASDGMTDCFDFTQKPLAPPPANPR